MSKDKRTILEEFYQLPLIDKVTWYLRDLASGFERQAIRHSEEIDWVTKCMFAAGVLEAAASFLQGMYGKPREIN